MCVVLFEKVFFFCVVLVVPELTLEMECKKIPATLASALRATGTEKIASSELTPFPQQISVRAVGSGSYSRCAFFCQLKGELRQGHAVQEKKLWF